MLEYVIKVMDSHILEDIGLTGMEARVYIALLELGSSSTGKIVEKSKASSSKIYEILDKLIDKGLASFVIKSGVKHFEAAAPTRLLDYVDERKRLLADQEKEVSALIPELELKRSMAGIGSETQVFKGMQGAKTSFDDILKEMKKGEEYLVLGISTFTPHFERFVVNFHRKRAEAGIRCRIILNINAKEIGEKLAKLPLTKVEYVQKELYTPFVFIVYKDKTLISIGLDEVFVQIRSENLSTGLQSYFDYLWNQDTQIKRGVDAVQEVFEEMLEAGSVDFIGARGYFFDARPEYTEEWTKRASKKGFVMRNLVDLKFKGHQITKLPFTQTKYTLSQEFSKLSVFWIYGNKVVISNWAGNEPLVIHIENKSLHQLYEKQFELLWNQTVTVYQTPEDVWSFLEELLEEDHLHWIGGNFGMKEAFPKKWGKYKKLRVEKKCFWHDLLDNELLAQENLSKEPYYESRVLPKELQSPNVTCIFGNKVANITWAKEKTIIVVNENVEAAKSQRKYFDYLWKNSS